jgi:TPP-dependent pyruvate/acetoin dehydrogenase alpha subunit
VFKLPVLLVCENNLYSTESPLSTRQPEGTDLCERARSFKIQSEKVNGNDVYAMYDATTIALAQIRAGRGPVFLECMTYRWREHVGPLFDHEMGRTYRTKEELEQWMQKCPVKHAANYLLSNGLATENDLEQWRLEVEEKAKKAVTLGKQSAWPDASTLFENVW